MRFVSLGGVLFGFWLALSGHYTPLLLGFGLLSTLGCVLLAQRMDIVDVEGHPSHLIFRAPGFFIWLIIEIFKSAWTVTRVVLDPNLPISPTLVSLKAGQKTPLGVNVYGNSITLTPGTITVGVEGNDLKVHALMASGAEDLLGGEMDRRVSRFEGEKD